MRAAVQIADAEGLTALSMRRLAGELGVPTMSLYRHVADKEELMPLMMDLVFAGNAPPDPPPDGWRAQLEALCRLQWQMYRRHPWIAEAVSFTRPLLAPNAMAHTEWAMRALDECGLDENTTFIAAVTMANYVRGTAVGIEAEAQAEQETGLTDEQWMNGQGNRFAEVMASGRYPMLSRYLTGEPEFDLDQLMEFGLQRLLDGLARLVPSPRSAPEDGDRGVHQGQPDDGQEVSLVDLGPLAGDEHHHEDQDRDHQLDAQLDRVRFGVAAAAQRRRQATPVSTWMIAPHSIAGLIRNLPDRYCITAPPSSSAKPTRCAYRRISRRASTHSPSLCESADSIPIRPDVVAAGSPFRVSLRAAHAACGILGT